MTARQARAAGRRAPWLVLGTAFLLVVWRSFYSFCWSDESFYLAIAHRFWLGELPFVDEWNPAQIYVVLLMPFYSLYRAVFGTTEGIYLAARLAYAVLSGGAACFVYAALREESRAGALAGALLCLFYSRANIGGLSYYNLSLLFSLVGCAALWCAAGRLRPRQGGEPSAGARRAGLCWCFFSGAVMALAVVCTPFFALLWVLALLPVLPRFARWRLPAALFVLGSGASAGCYLGWVLARVPLSRLLEMLPYVMSDPEANVRSLKTLLMAFALPVYQFRYTLPLWGGALAYICWRLWVRRGTPGPRFTAREARLPAGLALAALLADLILSGRMLGRPHAALCLAALALFLLLPDERRPWRAFFCFGLPGGVLAFSWQLSSNTRFSGMTIGFALASVWAALTAARFAAWLRDAAGPSMPSAPAGTDGVPAAGGAAGAGGQPGGDGIALLPRPAGFAPAALMRALPTACLILCLACPVLAAGVQRMVLVYRDDAISRCDTRIGQGPARGLYTSAENARLYGEACAQLAGLPEDAGPLYISSLMPWGYLVRDLPCGAPASWRAPLDFALLPDYYAVNPRNFPRTVLVLRPEYGRYLSTVEGTSSDQVNANVSESWFLDQLAARGYTVTEVACGWLYTAP